ncbi:hypothetical protein PFISCL1PPCAC_28813, partial [Pristionchus fissidentatus]
VALVATRSFKSEGVELTAAQKNNKCNQLALLAYYDANELNDEERAFMEECKEEKKRQVRSLNPQRDTSPDITECTAAGMGTPVNLGKLSVEKRAFLNECYDYYEKLMGIKFRPDAALLAKGPAYYLKHCICSDMDIT